MKHVLGFFGFLALGLLLLTIAAPAKGQGIVHRIVHFADPVPPTPVFEEPPRGSGGAIGPVAAPTPPWRVKEREGDRACAAGDFLAAFRAYADASPKAPPGDGMRLRARADRANVFRLLAEGVEADPGPDRAADEAEYRRRLDAIRPGSGAGAYLELADYCAMKGLRSHLAFLYERAFEKPAAAAPGVAAAPADDAVQKKVTEVVRKLVAAKKAEASEAPKEMLESLIRELPSSEAADIAREETGIAGGGPGFTGVEKRGGVASARPEDRDRLASAFALMKTGDKEYRAAIPGSRDVNIHRRAALDAFTKARAIFEEVDRAMANDGHQREIHDCNRNIAELRKDLPIGK